MRLRPITKAAFKKLHANGDLLLLLGGSTIPLDAVIDKIDEILLKKHPAIELYAKATSNHGDLSTTKDGLMTVNIYQDDRIILVETIVDSSKDKYCSWNSTTTYISAYLVKERLKLGNTNKIIALKEQERANA